MLTYNAEPAEIAYGCVFAENFDSVVNATKNGGTVTGTVKGGKLYCVSGTGASFARSQMNLFLTNGGSLRVRWTLNETGSSSRPILFYGIDANYLIKVLHKGSDGAINVELRNGSGNNYYKVTGSAPANGVVDIVVTWNKAGTTLTLFVNGVYADNDTTAGSLTFTDGTTFGALQVGFADGLTASTDVAIDTVMVYDKTILAVFGTEGIALDYYRNSTFDYEKRASVILPMTADCHDATNNRTLDASGKGNHFTFGDGATSTTYPTKLARRGYSFDGTDYLSANTNLPADTYSTFIFCFKPEFAASVAVNRNLLTSNDNNYAIVKHSTPTLRIILGGTVIENIALAAFEPYWRVSCINVLVVSATSGNTNVYLNGFKILDAKNTVWTPAPITSLGLGWNGTSQTFLGSKYYFSYIPIMLSPLQVIDATLKLQKNINLI